ncbi:putative inner membrane protein [Salmonella enterica subsp. enterica serovar Typhimurium str. DT104]|nr:putative inner membrane protein [Salmonella enterica subsp. enterica serovar Typhimurium str. DT104]
MNVTCDGPSERGPSMGRVIRSQHISNLKYEGYVLTNAYRIPP